MLNILKNIRLDKYSTFKIGGPAKEFVEVENEKEMIEALKYARDNQSKYFILGGGSNVLFDDKGFDGLVIKTKGSGKEIELISESEKAKSGESYREIKFIEVKCWAGENLSALVNFAKEKELEGLEWAVGIPGTIGGAIAGNAGAWGKEVAELVESVSVFKSPSFIFPASGRRKSYNREKCEFEYRQSVFSRKNNLVIISVKLKLQQGIKDEIEKKMKDFIEKRKRKQPLVWFGSAGSFFKNPIVKNPELIKKFENEKNVTCQDGKIPAGWLIDKAGFKGRKFKNVSVSDLNANFLINNGEGTSEEIIIAAGIIKQKVKEEFGINLEEEVRYISY